MHRDTLARALRLMESQGYSGYEWKVRYLFLNFLWKLSKGYKGPARSVRSYTYTYGEDDPYTEEGPKYV